MIVWDKSYKEGSEPFESAEDPGLHRYVYLTKERYKRLPWYLQRFFDLDVYHVVYSWYEALPKYNPEEYQMAKDNDWLPAKGKVLALLPVQ